MKLIAEGTSEQVNFFIENAVLSFTSQSTLACNNNNAVLYEWVVGTNTDDIILIIFP